jgi:O-antigen biosynthesis protein
LIVGTPAEFDEINALLKQAGLGDRVLGRVAANGNKEDAIATLSQLKLLMQNTRAREIIFAQGFLSYQSIINSIQMLPPNICVRFHAHGSGSIVGSDSKDASGEYVSVDGRFQLAHPYQRRMKRLTDVGVSLSILITFPLQLFICGFNGIYQALLVLINQKTWVGFGKPNQRLPQILPGVLNTAGEPNVSSDMRANAATQQVDIWYARQYHWFNDLKIIYRNYRKLRG